MGFRAEVRENLTLDDLKKSIEEGVPVIVEGQAWKEENQTWEMNENGHYMVVIGVDSKNVYLEDPGYLAAEGMFHMTSS
ncbi:C39 family peptidase [Methanosarcina horonobensis]|uniref:C39 family peptidase n=1 Tax=Methanosarcina horonobensis TaxID=418008 RepID=UPI000B046522|nr:C39 family peptidase [Methanosarcina horonobensis]